MAFALSAANTLSTRCNTITIEGFWLLIMHFFARSAAAREKSAIETFSPQRIVVMGAQKSYPEPKFELCDYSRRAGFNFILFKVL